jgi:hypothetical protein
MSETDGLNTNERKEELINRFSNWLDEHNLYYVKLKVFDMEFHAYQTIEKTT